MCTSFLQAGLRHDARQQEIQRWRETTADAQGKALALAVEVEEAKFQIQERIVALERKRGKKQAWVFGCCVSSLRGLCVSCSEAGCGLKVFFAHKAC